MMGPIIGQALYTFVNFELTFYIFAGVLCLGMVVIMIVIPNKINHAEEIMTKSEIDQYFERLKSTDGASSSFLGPKNSRVLMRSDAKTSMSREITYWMFLRNRRAMMSVLSAVLAMVFMLFFESILTMHLINDMKLSENTAGYFFGLICATYAISSPFVGCLTTFISRKWLTFSAFLIAFVALLMFGPS